jgi:hypothetical protein
MMTIVQMSEGCVADRGLSYRPFGQVIMAVTKTKLGT